MPTIISDWRALVAAGLLALGFGGQARAAAACELIYEVDPHAEAQQLIGAETFARLATLSWEERQRLTRRQSVQANSILRVSKALDKDIDIAGIQIIQGGYEGKTNPAITVRLSMDSALAEPETFMVQVSRLAAMFGYIYYQDSVLVLCPASAKSAGDNTVRKHVVTDADGQPFLSPETARYLYGMMMGRHGVVDNTGYSYDPESRQFMVLDLNEPGFEPDKLLREIAAFLHTLSSGRVKLKVDTSTALIDFPHNSWAGNPQGQAYLKTLPADASRVRLGKIRAAYLQALSGPQPAVQDQPRKATP